MRGNFFTISIPSVKSWPTCKWPGSSSRTCVSNCRSSPGRVTADSFQHFWIMVCILKVLHFQQNTHMSFPFYKNPGTDELSSAILSATCAFSQEIMKDVQDVKPMKKNMSWKIVASLHHIIDPGSLLFMMSSKHEGDILPTSVTKKKGNWVIKLSNESNAILRTPIEFTAGSNLIKFVCSHGGGCPFFSGDKVKRYPSWFLDIHLRTYYPSTSIDPSIHSFICTQDLCQCVCACVCILGYD